MAISHSEPPAQKKKNRRKMSKKATTPHSSKLTTDRNADNSEDEEMTVEPISGSSKLEHPTSDETLVSNFDNGDGDKAADGSAGRTFAVQRFDAGSRASWD